jgi:hypothetical protein
MPILADVPMPLECAADDEGVCEEVLVEVAKDNREVLMAVNGPCGPSQCYQCL